MFNKTTTTPKNDAQPGVGVNAAYLKVLKMQRNL